MSPLEEQKSSKQPNQLQNKAKAESKKNTEESRVQKNSETRQPQKLNSSHSPSSVLHPLDKSISEIIQSISSSISQSILLNRTDRPIFSVKCPSGNKVQFLCTNHHCMNAWICSNEGCQHCQKGAHSRCKILQLSGLTELLSKWIIKCRGFMHEVLKIDCQLIQVLNQNRRQLQKMFYFGNFEEQYRQFAQDLCLSQQLIAHQITGQQVDKFNKWLQKDYQHFQFKRYHVLERYQNNTIQITKKIKDSRGSFYKYFNTLKDLQGDELYNSKILQKDDIPKMKENVDYIKKILDRPKKLTLLFRASEWNFRAQAFHKKCDGIEDTLILVRTEFNRTIAAYSSYKWNQVRNGFVRDGQKRVFLLSLQQKQKMVARERDHLIYCSQDWGPFFGQHDLAIADKCQSNKESYAKFPTTYNHEGTCNYFSNDQDSYHAFSGATSGYHFKVEQYEVYKIIW